MQIEQQETNSWLSTSVAEVLNSERPRTIQQGYSNAGPRRRVRRMPPQIVEAIIVLKTRSN